MSEANENEQSGDSPESAQTAMEDRIINSLYGDAAEDQPEPDQPETEGDEPAEPVAADEQSEETEGETAEGEAPKGPELVEVEFSGKQYKLPPELKDALMAQSDYTRKTQEVAEQRRMIEHQKQIQQQEAQFQQTVAPELQQLQQLDWQLAAYKGLDWTSMDTETMTRTRVAMDQLKDARGDLVNALNTKRNEFTQQRQNLLRQATDRANEYLKRHIPNWGAETGRELTSYGMNEGFTDVELNAVTDPRFIKMLWKANQWDKLKSQQGTATRRADKAPPVAKPGASKPQSQSASDANYRKALKSAKTSSEKSRIIQARLEHRWG